MAFARDVYTASGGQTDYTISFPYQEQEDVRVYQNGSLVDTADYTFPNATTIRLDTGATSGDTIVLQRYTSQDTRTVDFTAGPLTESDLDNSAIQSFYMAQEAIDVSNENLGKDSGERWDAEGTRIVNVGSPTAGTDAVTKDYADALAAGTLGSPISIANGGTAATTAAAALASLGAVPVGTNPASGVSYSNGTSGLVATDAQEAIDEIVDEFVPNTNATSYGFYTTVNSVDSTNDIDISAGQCWDTTRASFMSGSAMTKRGDATWSAGDNGGFIDTGSMSSNEGYHVYAMINDVDGSVDYIMSLSGTWAGVTKPSNYTKGQIIGYAYRDTAWVEMVWSGNACVYKEAPQAFSDSTVTDQNFETYDAKCVPRNGLATFFVAASNSTPSATFPIYLRHTVASSLPFGGNNTVTYVINSAAPNRAIGASVPFLVDDSRQMQMATYEISGTTTLSASVPGFTLTDRLEATS